MAGIFRKARGIPILLGLMLMALMSMTGIGHASEHEAVINGADTAWMLVATALVMLMTPGVALFYGGMVRAKNVLSTLMMSFAVLCMVTIQWVVLGYTLSFGTDVGGLIGGLEAMGLAGISGAPGPIAANLPGYVFVLFQGTFAIITLALVTGGLVGRIKFSALMVFGLLWTTIIYDPLAHMVWGGGLISQMGALDFAGGTVVHIAAGVAALVAAIVLGRRKDHDKERAVEPHNIPMVVIGAALLWFGWFGFNGGSGLAANGLAGSAVIATQIAAAAAALTWMLISWRTGRPSVLGIATGSIAGLVAITPAAGFVNPMGAIVIGVVAGAVSYYAVAFRIRSKVDDTLDVFAVHGMAGIWGSIATGILADPAVNGPAGALYGNVAQLWIQIEAVAISVIFVAVGTLVLAKLIDAVMGLRVGDKEEVLGLDLSQHGEIAYSQRVGGSIG